MKKIFLILLFTFLTLNTGFAATGAATEYEVTMKKVELCSDATCTTPTIVVREIWQLISQQQTLVLL